MLSACRQLPSPTARSLWALGPDSSHPLLSVAQQGRTALARAVALLLGDTLVLRQAVAVWQSPGHIGTTCPLLGTSHVAGDMEYLGCHPKCFLVVPQCWGCPIPTPVLLARLRLQGLAIVPVSPPHPTHGVLTHWPRIWSARTQKRRVARCSSCALQSRCPDAG